MSRLLRVAVSLLLLLGVAWLLDGGDIAQRLTHLDARWVLLALAISVPQVALSAYRWRFTAGRLGIELSFQDALREYYLATFLNQVLPGGVMGDVSRAWRHARVQSGPVVRAVVLERASGQVVMVAAAVISLLILPSTSGLDPRLAIGGAALAAAVIGIGLFLAPRKMSRTVSRTMSRTVWSDVRQTLLGPDVIATQLISSALVVGSYIAIYVVAARAVGVATPIGVLAPLVSPVLMSMLIPTSIAGWGVREATAAGLWSVVGLTAEDGVAISAAYGMLVLISSLPGALVLLSAGRDRTGRRRPDESDGTADAAPAPGYRSPEA